MDYQPTLNSNNFISNFNKIAMFNHNLHLVINEIV